MLKGKSALVTGCARGIGRAVLETFARNGAKVWACVRKPDNEFSDYLGVLSRETGVEIVPLYFDLTHLTDVKAAVQKVRDCRQPLDILVNNAGVIYTALFQMTPIEKLREIFEVNFFSQMFLTQHISKIMVQHKSGSIVNVSSSSAIEGNAGRGAYAASKAALISATQVMAEELAAFNIRVNAVAPGLTQTDMMGGSTPPEVLNQTLARISLKRVGSPQEIANSILFLSSPLASYITGQVIRVDGGM